jgi:ribosomal protein S18 acetylase RimI-like enzyme
MHQADGVCLVWPPVVLPAGDEREIARGLMQCICRELDRPDVKFGQCLLSAAELAEARLLSEFGFEIAAELFFLARGVEEPWPETSLPSEDDGEIFDDATNRDRFAALIERTYVDSLDCPGLNGTRTGEDALAGHRLSGEFHPRGWRLFRCDGRDAAVLLLNEHPDQDAVELVYFGVAPEFRGRGWGRRLVAQALATTRDWCRAALFLAVDAKNTFANSIYDEFGFQELARRSVWLKVPERSARQ